MWDRLIKSSRKKGWSSKKAKGLFLNENHDLLSIKCSNLHRKKKEQDLLDLFKTQNFLNVQFILKCLAAGAENQQHSNSSENPI
jgi:hypothetical protein